MFLQLFACVDHRHDLEDEIQRPGENIELVTGCDRKGVAVFKAINI
jgi:hypothetical protein